ncbi:MAG: hypothetical protein JWP06_889 [Candidatus Saccharibacteria bacterium]|nr:hypothetical protein [Candidatus Saccharibacteria bacterium]
MDIKKKSYLLLVGFLAIIIGLSILGYRHSRPAVTTAPKPTIAHTPPGCSNGNPAHASISSSDDAVLQKLSEYETVCPGVPIDTMMLFAAMPTSDDEASTSAKNTASRLKEFAKYNIQPLVSFEPNADMPTIINDIRAGKYDTILASYFQDLKAAGISSEQLGTWVLFPEANTPTWHNTDPATFTANVMKLATIQRQVFPDCQLTILLNNTTYTSNDEQWSHGVKKDFGDYVNSIPAGTLDSFGYQGFPFVAPKDASTQYDQLDAKDFLPLATARNAANKLHTKKIWLNTGTFRYAHTDSDAQLVTLSLSQRQQTLDGIARQASEFHDQGFDVSLNLFAMDKTNESEHINWSYWPAGNYSDSPDTRLFKAFFEQLHNRQIHLSLYDSKP